METLYLKGLYERLTLPSGNVEHKYYVGNTVVIDSTDAKQSKTLYTHKDHLGSTVTVTDANGSVVQHINYDAWGKQNRFYTSSSLVSLLNQQSPVESNGYTGHKEISDLGIIHMNGRVYDYNLGRFMSVDPVIQSPTNSQSINPYSYIMNNPLSGTDPTGYAAKEVEKKIKVSTIGSRIQRTVTATAVSNGNGGATITFSGGNGASRNAAKSAVAGKFSGAGFNVVDIGSQSDVPKVPTGENKAGGGTRGVAANATTAGSLPQGGTTTTPNIGDLADGLGKELIGALKKGLILYALKPGELADGTLEGAIARGEIDENELILYHYTNSKENLDSIVATQTLRASFGEKNARYGPGQYFTDVHPGMIAAETVAGLTKDDITLGNMSKGQAARLLFGDARKKASFNYYLRIDVGGLPIQNPRPNVYYLPNDKPLDLRGRIKGYGATLDSN